MYCVAGDMNTVYKHVVAAVHRTPEHSSSPRGQRTLEVLNGNIVLENPRARLITSPHRKVNYSFGVGEFIWYWRGRRDLAFIERYNKRLANFSDDGYTLNSAYGYRLLGTYGHGGLPESNSQWQTVIDLLRRDPDSRQAVMHILVPSDLKSPTKDVPCTCTLQFFVRDGRLHMHTHMRSNDVFWGLPYDVFSFTLMQEAMALELGVGLGRYHHTAGSLHIYERHFDDATAIEEEFLGRSEPMAPIHSLQSLQKVCEAETYVSAGLALPEGHVTPPSSAEEWMMDRLYDKWGRP